jgi:tRNA(Ser,Leu) C12 N-acetylase TAN1
VQPDAGGGDMKDWNVVVTVYQEGFRPALKALRKLGTVERSPYHNVLVMSVEDPLALLEAVERQVDAEPALYDAIARVAPIARWFEFHSADEFEEKAGTLLVEWAPRLAHSSFHVRLHRRGLHSEIHTQDVERHLDEFLLALLQQAGTPGSVSFTDPDAVIAVETIDDRAGVSLWMRTDLERHRLLRPD